jgi:hypothetical protein
LHVELDAVEIVQGRSTVETVLLPTIDSAPRGEEFWNPIRFYTVRLGKRQRPEVLAGISPMTGIYPSAAGLDQLRVLYWYDADTDTWYDPTSDELGGDGRFRVSRDTKTKVRGLLKAWVTEAIRRLSKPDALGGFGLTARDKTDLLNEFTLWRDDIPGKAADNVIPTEDAGIPRARSASDYAESLPILDHACETSPDYLISDLPIHEGPRGTVLLVTREQLLNRATRIYGRVFGDTDLEAAVDGLPANGDNLGLDLGFPDEHLIPIGYVFVDELFSPNLTFLNESGFSNEWSGLEIDREFYLLPFKPEILNYLTPDELKENTSARLTPDGEAYEVTLSFGDTDIRQSYSATGQGKFTLNSTTIPPDAFDLRLFPNVNLEELPDGHLSPKEKKYYARVRLAPKWDFNIGPMHYDAYEQKVSLDEGEFARTGQDGETGDGVFAAGETLFITCREAPSGFYVRGYGLCLLRLPPPKGTVEEWDVGIDFGTSNTCVAYRVGDREKTETLTFPTLTTTLFKKPSYDATFDSPYGKKVNEGASALLDFFFRKSETDPESLNWQEYFPTQVITRQSKVQEDVDWDFENGLIHFKNFALSQENDVKELISTFGEYARKHAPRNQLPEVRFHVKQDIKWENTAWLETFMRHLRTQLLMTAAQKNATIADLKFSYPKSFSVGKRDNFRGILRRVWKNELKTGSFLLSESEAVQNHIVRDDGQFIIFDVGGGTTDVIAFNRSQPIFQTSFEVAARQINQYVSASRLFRAAFQEAYKRVLGPDKYRKSVLKYDDEFVDGKEELVDSIWLGLLEDIERRDDGDQILNDILSMLRTDSDAVPDAETQKAVRGFFLSVVLMFSGLGFFGGALIQAYASGNVEDEERGFALEFVDLVPTGNGSKLLRMIDHEINSFAPVMKAMTRAGIAAYSKEVASSSSENPDDQTMATLTNSVGSGEDHSDETSAEEAIQNGNIDINFSGIYTVDGKVAPKSTVALGLLSSSSSTSNESNSSVPVANLLGETGYPIDGEIGAFHDSLLDYYEYVSSNTGRFQIPSSVPPYLSAFLDTLNEELPKGNNRGLSLIPGIGSDWNEHLKEDLYFPSRRAIMTRISANAQEFASKMQTVTKENLPALESLFVIELSALLDAIRDHYAAPQ